MSTVSGTYISASYGCSGVVAFSGALPHSSIYAACILSAASASIVQYSTSDYLAVSATTTCSSPRWVQSSPNNDYVYAACEANSGSTSIVKYPGLGDGQYVQSTISTACAGAVGIWMDSAQNVFTTCYVIKTHNHCLSLAHTRTSIRGYRHTHTRVCIYR